MKYIYIIKWGRYFTDDRIIGDAFFKKENAEKHLRDRGYRFNKRQELFLNEAIGIWAKVEKVLIRDRGI